jgi:hypothetical protein
LGASVRRRRELEEVAESLGMEVIQMIDTGCHVRMVLEHRGQRAVCFAATTPGDHRDLMNTKRDMKKAFVNRIQR